MTTPLSCYGYGGVPWKLPPHLEHCRGAVLAWRDWGHTFAWANATTIRGVFYAVKQTLSYEPDPEGQDRWQHPESLICGPSISYLHGDCEDFALCFAGLTHRALGISPEDIFITVYHDLTNSTNQSIHAVCVVRTDEGNRVLDQRALEVMDDRPTDDIRPIFSISLDGDATLHKGEL